MARIELRERRATEGLVALGTGICVAVAIGLLVSAKGGQDQLSRQELARQEAAARQQADLDRAWRPWVTGSENLVVVSLCVTVSVGIAGLGLTGVHLFVRRRSIGDLPQPRRSDETVSGPVATQPRGPTTGGRRAWR